jgi:RNA polymerase sigma factor (sigma-70 family)
MAKGRYGAAFREIRTLFSVGTAGERSDADLLERFVAGDREAAELAFSALVARHGPMVLRVCRSVLRDAHEADDAFQATFFVLARRARSIRNGSSLASWLHGVARRVALCARASAWRRRIYEHRAAEQISPFTDGPSWDNTAEVLHAEIQRLPDRFRSAIVLCGLEGLTEGQAAERLGWPIGTVRSRLLRGRERLRSRLTRRGMTFSVGLLVSNARSDAASAAVPVALANSTIQSATALAGSGWDVAMISSPIAAALSRKVLASMVMMKLAVPTSALLTVIGTSLLTASVGFTQDRSREKAEPGRSAENPRRQGIAPGGKTRDDLLAEEIRNLRDEIEKLAPRRMQMEAKLEHARSMLRQADEVDRQGRLGDRERSFEFLRNSLRYAETSRDSFEQRLADMERDATASGTIVLLELPRSLFSSLSAILGTLQGVVEPEFMILERGRLPTFARPAIDQVGSQVVDRREKRTEKMRNLYRAVMDLRREAEEEQPAQTRGQAAVADPSRLTILAAVRRSLLNRRIRQITHLLGLLSDDIKESEQELEAARTAGPANTERQAPKAAPAKTPHRETNLRQVATQPRLDVKKQSYRTLMDLLKVLKDLREKAELQTKDEVNPTGK